MASVRIDPLTGTTVVVSERRIPAPPAFRRGTLPQVASCPFCPGSEDETGPSITEHAVAGEWRVRAFPNRRPGLRPEEPHHRIGASPLRGWTAVGAHEVLVEGRAHEAAPLPVEIQQTALEVIAERTRDLRNDTRNAAVGWFRNRGVEGGSSQPHPHSQVVAMGVLPASIQRMVEHVRADSGVYRSCIERARAEGRVVFDAPGVVAFAPWAPRSAFEIWFMPTDPAPFLWSNPEAIPDLARGLTAVEGALHEAFGFAPHNVALYDAPCHSVPEGFRWHMRLAPRLIPTGGFEQWSDGAMHPIAPDQAGAVLRGFMP